MAWFGCGWGAVAHQTEFRRRGRGAGEVWLECVCGVVATCC